ncbi:MAG: hypothetical protein WAN36_09525 [Calditrichia bacterium]
MKNFFIMLTIGISALFILTCGGSRKEVNVVPQEGKSLLVGAVAVYNEGIEDVYEVVRKNIHVVVIGQFRENGKLQEKGYRAKTDENGYYFIPNVPKGAYVVKGIEVDVAFGTHLIITSRWEGNTQVYQPISTMIDNNVKVWPEPDSSRIINMDISYFRIDAVHRVFDESFTRLNPRDVSAEDMPAMEAPPVYFQNKYPNWQWF